MHTHAEEEATAHSTGGRTFLSSLRPFRLHGIHSEDVCPNWSDNRHNISKHRQIYIPHR